MAGFFDKMVTGINKGVSSVSEGSRSFVEKARINTQIQETQKERDNFTQSLGTLIYNLISSGAVDIPQCNGICAEIKACDEKLNGFRQQLAVIEQQRLAAQQMQQMPPRPANGVICRNCGCANEAAAKFCAGCGKPMGAPEQPMGGPAEPMKG